MQKKKTVIQKLCSDTERKCHPSNFLNSSGYVFIVVPKEFYGNHKAALTSCHGGEQIKQGGYMWLCTAAD